MKCPKCGGEMCKSKNSNVWICVDCTGDDVKKSATAIMEIVGQSLGIAFRLATLIGDVVTAKKVQAILDDADFPSFARRAAAVGDEALEAFKPRP